MIENTSITFRHLQGEADYELMQSILMASTKADQIIETASVDDIRSWCAPTRRFDPQNDILFALGKRKESEYTEIGFSRVSWYTGKEDTQLYCQISFLVPEYREQGVWPEIVRENERRLREISTSDQNTPKRFFQAWATETQEEWISVLEKEEYKAVRHFNNMLRPLESIPAQELPVGIKVRPVQPEHYRSIWEAQKEVHKELFETVAENWTDGNYKAWLKNPSHTPHLWQVAWDGNQVAGMVLARINEAENRELDRKRGYTEHIFVRKPWRRRGLASALIIQSLRALKMQGMEEAELGVDSENESGAYEFYKRMGYQTSSTDIWFRKPMDEKSDRQLPFPP
jgi:mycothiol synthase